MPDQPIDVVAIGNAIVDVICPTDDAFLAAHELHKGSMALIDAARAEELYAAMPPASEFSGGSAANAAAGVASFGGRAAFIGRVRDDQFGAVFAHDIRSVGVEFDVHAAPDGPPTARSLILVTPDAQRTMNTYLGAAQLLAPDDVDESVIARSRIVFCEGYLWDIDAAKDAMRKAMDAVHAAGGKVAFSLSDALCVDRHRAEFLDLAERRVDILFANEDEICSLYEIDDFDQAQARVRAHCELAFLTRSEKGSVVVSEGEVHHVAAHPVSHVADTTGAGDLYAAGALFGLTAGYDTLLCGRLGSLAASEVISHLGARPEVALSELAAGLLEGA